MNTACRIGSLSFGWCAALCLLAGGVSAGDYYVTPTGAGSTNGVNWHDAISNLQAAVNLAVGDGDRIYLRWGVYSNASQIVISNAANLSVVGGCNGLSGGSSNDYSGTNSTLTKAGATMRIIYGTNSTVTLQRLTVSGGYFSSGSNSGAGLCLYNCAATLSNCVVCNNTNLKNVAATDGGSGGGLFCSGGSLAVNDCVFSNNIISMSYFYDLSGGGAIAGVGTPMTIAGTLFVTNTSYAGNGTAGGGAINCTNASSLIITNCVFLGNASRGTYGIAYGGALYLNGVTSSFIVNSAFISNAQYSVGPAVFQGNVQSAVVRSNYFSGNYGAGAGNIYGSALNLTGCSTAAVERCLFTSQGRTVYGDYLLVSNCVSVSIRDTTAQSNGMDRGISSGGAAASLVISNCLAANNGSDGICVWNGTATVAHCVFTNNLGRGVRWASAGPLGMSNCLAARNGGDGLLISSGTVAAASCTFVDNGGWGCNLSGGTGTVLNSIAWGNGSGGVASNGNLFVDFSCLQGAAFGGASNRIADPLFVSVPDAYYLSVDGLLGQTANSPCIAAGSNSAAYWGLTNRTTRTDGAGDTNAPVDLGYHYAAGVSTSAIRTVTNCYVDAANGANTNSGASWGAAWESLTHALSNVAAHATIHVAAGTYDAANGEAFPLTVQMPGLTLAASNANPALTVLDNAGTAGRRVLQASNKGAILIKGLTMRGGYFASGENSGAGLCFQSCAAMLTNCVVRDNTNMNNIGTYVAWYGGAMYCSGGSLAVNDCLFSNNYMYQSAGIPHGGAICGSNTPMLISGTMFVTNKANSGNGVGLGGAVNCLAASSLVISNCVFLRNSCLGTYGTVYGGAVYVKGGAQSVIADSTFVSNSHSSFGPAVYQENIQSATVRSNYFSDNYGAGAGNIYGSALNLTGCSTAVVDRCWFTSQGQPVLGDYVCVSNCAYASILDTTVRSNSVDRGIACGGAAAARLLMSNCLAANNGSDGIYVMNGTATVVHCEFANNLGVGARWAGAGTLRMTNCLSAQNGGDGLLISAGTAAVANCTLADNGGWGCNLSGGTGTVLNSIGWGNIAGGFASNASLGVTYSCLQSQPYGSGTGNIVTNPLFAPVPGCYYLSETNLAEQTNHSPCVDAGLGNASDYGLDARTTRTDGTNDTGVVDLGYHYTNGAAVPHLVPVCYVDGVNGNNGNSGLAWTSAWKSVTYAMTNVAGNGTINLATGVYSAAATLESFPLVVQMSGLTLAASNANPALTVLDNAGTAGRQVLQAWGKGNILLKGLTIRGGYFASGQNKGAGLCFLNCYVTLTNCVVRDNTNYCDHNTLVGGGNGGGMFCSGGTLAVNDCIFSNNFIRANLWLWSGAGGGGLAVSNTPATIAGTWFVTNTAYTDNGCPAGGALNSMGASSLVITNCVFLRNVLQGTYGGSVGGAIYAGAGLAALIANSVFVSNYLYNGDGDAIYCTAIPSVSVRSNYFADNYGGDGVSLRGSALNLTGCATGVVDRCLVESRRRTVYGDYLCFSNSVDVSMLDTTVRSNVLNRGVFFGGPSAGRLVVSNCLVAYNGSDGMYLLNGTATVVNCAFAKNGGGGMRLMNGVATLVNCTLANNVGWGIARPTTAALTVKNSILWGNTLGGIGHNQNLILTYTDTQDGWAAAMGGGNISADPLFVDAAGGDYHEMGVEGSYHNGAWTPDARNSPCLDAGDPASDWSLEPKPCGNRINVGAYGNTAEATRSLPKMGTVLRVW